jgi:hypothetical protein
MVATGTVVSDITLYCQYVLSHDKRSAFLMMALVPALWEYWGAARPPL